MKQIVMDGPRKSHVEEVPEPTIAEDQILVKLTYTGMCHSEWYPWSTAKQGDVFGHETVGDIWEAVSRSFQYLSSPARNGAPQA